MTRNLTVFHVIYWFPKIHKIPSGARFIIAGKKCINKQLSKHVTSAFKLYASTFLYFFYCNSVSCSGSSALHGVNSNFKKRVFRTYRSLHLKPLNRTSESAVIFPNI